MTKEETIIEDAKKVWKESEKYKNREQRKAFLAGAEFAANVLGEHNFKKV